MADLGTFNADEHKDESFGVIPVGWYAAIITGSEKTQSKNKPQNSYLKVEFTVQTDGFKGRKLWMIINLWNDNTTAVEIAQRDLAAICRAVGVTCPQDSNALHNIPLGIKIAHRDYNGDPQEDIKGFCPESGLIDKEQPSAAKGAGTSPAPWEGGTEASDDIPF